MPGTLTHTQGDIVRQLLIDLGMGVDSQLDSAVWPVYAEGEPNKPDDCITAYSTQGRDDGRHMVSGERPEFHGFQVRVRSKTFKEGYAKARNIAVTMDTLVRLNNVAVDTRWYSVWSVTRTSDVLVLGADAPGSKRKLFTVNALVSIKETDVMPIIQTESSTAIYLEDGQVLSL